MKSGKKTIPLIKEYRIDKIKLCLKCINMHPFDRDKQKECILNLYPDKEDRGLEQKEKSIFRGMVVPSLRSLGFIIGYRDYIRLSANSRIIVESESLDNAFHGRALRAVVFETDRNIFQFTDIIRNAPIPLDHLLDSLDAEDLSYRSRNERVRKWGAILEQVGLITNSNGQLSINPLEYNQVLLDVDIKQKNTTTFRKHLFDASLELGRKTAGIVDIADIRESVAVEMLRSGRTILTEDQFDEMLRNVHFVTDDYIISLGKPMGAEEKLFEYRMEHFRTLSIKRLRRR